MRLWLKVIGSVVISAAAVLAVGNWKQSPLHRYVCGSETPFNVPRLLERHRAIDNWPAKLCGCTPPPGFAVREPNWVNGRAIRLDEFGRPRPDQK